MHRIKFLTSTMLILAIVSSRFRPIIFVRIVRLRMLYFYSIVIVHSNRSIMVCMCLCVRVYVIYLSGSLQELIIIGRNRKFFSFTRNLWHSTIMFKWHIGNDTKHRELSSSSSFISIFLCFEILLCYYFDFFSVCFYPSLHSCFCVIFQL